MPWSLILSVLLAIVASETTIVGWFLRNIYRDMRGALQDHDERIEQLNRSRELHRVRLTEVYMAIPSLQHRADWLDD